MGPMNKLSPTQTALLTELHATGSVLSPHTSNRASVAVLSGWCRTARSLARLGLAELHSNGVMLCLVPVGTPERNHWTRRRP